MIRSGKALLQLSRHVQLPRHADQRIFRWLVAVRWRKQRRPLDMRIVVRASGGNVHEQNVPIPPAAPRIESARSESVLGRMLRVDSESPSIGNQFFVGLRNSRPELAGGRSRRIWPEGTMSNAESRTPICKPGATERMPATISRKNRVRFSKLPPYFPSRVCALRNSCPR